jgi:hypothetical protein
VGQFKAFDNPNTMQSRKTDKITGASIFDVVHQKCWSPVINWQIENCGESESEMGKSKSRLVIKKGS